MNNTIQGNLHSWVASTTDPVRKKQREAIHTIIDAISANVFLKSMMAMKGGTLISFHYNGPRYSKDIDFSTEKMASREIINQTIRELNFEFGTISDISEQYGIECVVQSSELKPASNKASFQTLSITIGYAKTSDRNALKRLRNRQASDTIKIDYSFNERLLNIHPVTVGSESEIYAYTVHDIIAEKIRAVLQQDVRNRARRQDIYDLSYLIRLFSFTGEEKRTILESLVQKANSRLLIVGKNSLDSESLKRRALESYSNLKFEVDSTEFDFEKDFRTVVAFYKNLPWESLSNKFHPKA